MYKRKQGFTLVELLVVIGIIALLISILLPTLGRARSSAMNIMCQSNLRQLYTVTVMYMNESREYMPVPNVSEFSAQITLEESGTASYFNKMHMGIWYNALPKYLNMKPMGNGGRIRLWKQQAPNQDKLMDPNLTAGKSVFVCPAAAAVAGIPLRRSYAMNEFLKQNGHNNDLYPFFPHSADQNSYPLKISNLKKISNYNSNVNGNLQWNDIPMYIDGYWRPEPAGTDVNYYPTRSLTIAGNGWKWSDLKASRPHMAGNSSGFFHRSNPFAGTETDLAPGAVNCVFLDGRVETFVPGYNNGRFNPLDNLIWKDGPPGGYPDMYW